MLDNFQILCFNLISNYSYLGIVIMLSKNTIQRQLILEAVRALNNHPTIEEVYDWVRRRCPSISKGTVYRNIGVLEQEHFLRRIEIANAPDRVDTALTTHYHFLCKECGGIYDVQMPVMEDLLSRAPQQEGFIFQEHDIVFRGLCPKCSAGTQSNGSAESAEHCDTKL